MTEPCRRCKGEGLVYFREDIGGEPVSGWDICPDCENSGKAPEERSHLHNRDGHLDSCWCMDPVVEYEKDYAPGGFETPE